MTGLLVGALSTFADTVGLQLDLTNMVPLIVDPFDVPLYQRVASKPPSVNAVKHEWQEESLIPNKDQLNEALDDTETGIDVDNGNVFKAGDLIQVGDEIMRVESVASNTLTVARGYAGSTSVAHDDDTKVDIIGYAVSDGADPVDFRTTPRTPKFNYHQTFQEKVEVTTLDEWAQVFGIADKFGHEVEKVLKAMTIRASNAMFYGRRFEDPAKKTRAMGGLNYFIQTNIDSTTVTITEVALAAQNQNIYDQGGRADLICVGPKQKRAVSALVTSSMKRYDRPGAGESVGTTVSRYVSDFGDQEVMLDRNVRATDLYLLSTALISKISGQPFTLENLAKTGSSRKAQILGWHSFELKAEKRSARFTALT